MKKLSYLLSLVLLMTLTVFTSCKDDEQPPVEDTPLEENTEKLAGTWTVTSVTRPSVEGNVVDGETVTMTFTKAGAYSATNTNVMPGDDPVFPSGSNWSFPNETTFNRIIITPGPVNFDITTFTATSLTFTYTTQDTKSQGADEVITVSATKNP